MILRKAQKLMGSAFRILSTVLLMVLFASWLIGYLASDCIDGALRYYGCTIGEEDVSLAFTNLSWIGICVFLVWFSVALIFGALILANRNKKQGIDHEPRT